MAEVNVTNDLVKARKQAIELLALIVCESNKECANLCEVPDSELATFGTDPETAQAILQGIYTDVAEQVAKIQAKK